MKGLGMLVAVAFVIAMIVGEVKCIIKMVHCNWEPIGKAEAFYTIGTFTGLGCVFGYFEVTDK